MNALTNFNATQTMSSREIAELVEKRHDNVKRTIETLAETGVIVRPQIEDEPDTDAMGRTRITKVYVFSGDQGKRDSIIVVAQLCPEFTARLVDRWAELEAKHRIDPLAALNDPATMRGLLMTYSEKVIALETANAELAPKADALDHIANTEGSYAPTDAAKTLGIRPKDLFIYLRGPARWMYRRPGTSEDVAYQDKLQRGLMEHKITTVYRADGTDKTVTRARITAKGLALLATVFRSGAA